jgi:2TM domain
MAEQPVDSRRELAIKRIEAKRGFWMHAFVYVVINSLLVVTWYVTRGSFFWPIFPIAAWGIGLVMHAYAVFRGDLYTESDIQKELDRMPKDISGTFTHK